MKIYGIFNNSNLLIENIEITIDSRFNELDGLRILHFSDLHSIGPSSRFDHFFDKLGKVEADLVVVSGDLIDNDSGIDACVTYLNCLRPRYGTFVVYGNHDRHSLGFKEFVFYTWMKEFKENNLNLLELRLREKGINILDDSSVRLCVNGRVIKLTGIESPLGYGRFNIVHCPREKLDKLWNLVRGFSKDEYNILISHVPDLIGELDTHNINLILSSHTHGGQIRIPVLGPIFTWSRFQKKYNMGLYKYNNSYLQISSGLGASGITPFRFRCPPMASVIILRKRN